MLDSGLGNCNSDDRMMSLCRLCRKSVACLICEPGCGRHELNRIVGGVPDSQGEGLAVNSGSAVSSFGKDISHENSTNRGLARDSCAFFCHGGLSCWLAPCAIDSRCDSQTGAKASLLDVLAPMPATYAASAMANRSSSGRFRSRAAICRLASALLSKSTIFSR